MAEDYK